MELFVQAVFSALTLGSIYALVGLGFTIILMSSNVLNLAQGEFVMLGGLTMYALAVTMQLPTPIAFVLSVVIVAVAGALLEIVVIHPLLSINMWKQSPVFVLILITLAGGMLFQGLALLGWGKDNRSVPHFSGTAPLTLFGASIMPQTLWVIAGGFLVLAVLFLFFNYTLLGKRMRACADNRTAATLVGVNTRWIVSLSFAMSAGLGAVGGVLIMPLVHMNYAGGGDYMLMGLVAAVVGGLGSLAGPVLGGFLIGFLMTFLGILLPIPNPGLFKMAFTFIILMLVLAAKPNGLLGRKQT